MGGHRSKNGHRSGCDQCYKFHISFFILGLLRPSSWLRRGFFYLRKSSGSLAIVRRDAPRLILAEQLGCRASPRLILEIDIVRVKQYFSFSNLSRTMRMLAALDPGTPPGVRHKDKKLRQVSCPLKSVMQ
jgi:hypothetical protein